MLKYTVEAIQRLIARLNERPVDPETLRQARQISQGAMSELPLEFQEEIGRHLAEPSSRARATYLAKLLASATAQ
jgi:hypothetical protein